MYMYIQEGQTALHRASFAGNLDIVHLLVESGADVNKQGKVQLLFWLYFSCVYILLTLQDGSTPLHQSSGQGHVAIVQLLLDYKAKTSLRIKKVDCYSYAHSTTSVRKESTHFLEV